MNLYANLGELKRALRTPTSTTTHDAFYLEVLEAASRSVDNWCDRHFFAWQGVKYFGVAHVARVLIEDLLTATAVGADSETDGSFDGEAWVEGTDYVLYPRHKFPKRTLGVHRNSSKGLAVDAEYLKITGVWGFGDGISATPWRSTGTTATMADASTTTATLGAAALVDAGDTLLVESEQVYVESVSGTTATVWRGVNGTTAASHAAASASRACYPAPVKRFVIGIASEEVQRRTSQGVRLEMLGTHQIQYADTDERIFQRTLGPYRRVTTY